MTPTPQMLDLGVRIKHLIDDTSALQHDMKGHAVYSMEHMAAAMKGLTDAYKGMALSVGYAVIRDKAAEENVEKRLRR